jgi:hypothetical protein
MDPIEYDAGMDEIAELRRDAERYRWLRDHADGAQRDMALDAPCGLTADDPNYLAAHAAAVDAAIDAAMPPKCKSEGK